MYRLLRYPLPLIDFGSVRILRTYCLFIDLIIDNSLVFKHPLSGPNTHSVLKSGPYLLFVPRSGLNTTTESLSGPKAFVPEKRRPATGGEPFFFSLFLFYRIQQNFMPSMFPGKSFGMNRLQLVCKKNA